MIKQIAAIAFIVTAFSASSFAQSNKIKNGQVTLSWEEATRLVTGQKVALALPSGSMVEGKVLATTADSLTLDIRKTLDKTKQPKGPVTIPRANLHTLQLRKMGVKNRVILTAIGVAAGVGLGTALAIASNETGSGNENAIVLAPVAGGILGYLGGWGLDHHKVTITIP